MVAPARLAWDGARMIVLALDDERVYDWLHGELVRLYGPAVSRALGESRLRLWTSGRPDAPHVESGLWRARLTDLLQQDPGSAQWLGALTEATRQRLANTLPAAFQDAWGVTR